MVPFIFLLTELLVPASRRRCANFLTEELLILRGRQLDRTFHWDQGYFDGASLALGLHKVQLPGHREVRAQRLSDNFL